MLLYKLSSFISTYFDINIYLSIFICFCVIQFPIFMIFFQEEINEYYNNEASKLRRERQDMEKELLYKRDQLEHDILNHETENIRAHKTLENKELELHKLLATAEPFRYAAKMCCDMEMVIFKQSINYLKNKPKPALKAADEVKAMKRISSQILIKSKEIEYKYEYILSAFPEIGEYVDNDQDLLAIGKHMSYSDLDDMRDRRKDYLSSEEYNRLSESEKSQLALDRYIQNMKKDKWQIGRDYEMSCAFQLKSRGYHVEMHGIKYKKADLGRDLIAIKNIGGLFGHEVLIIQCKNWSQERTIHENVIMQLFGTTIEYQITLGGHMQQTIIPVLMIPSYSVVSNVAAQFAEKLKVKIERVENIDFPRIKCNINNGNKIYHLPFDQQYDRTEIKLQGECYAYTVAEAESKGFRRAMRHNFVDNPI